MEKRTVANKNEARDLAYGSNLEIKGKNLGRSRKVGFRIETGYCVGSSFKG